MSTILTAIHLYSPEGKMAAVYPRCRANTNKVNRKSEFADFELK